MSLSPSARRIKVAVTFTFLVVVLNPFLPSPDITPASLIWSVGLGLVIGYLMWPWFEPIQFPPGFFQPAPLRLIKTMGAGGIGAVVLLALGMVTGNNLNAVGLLVAFLFVAAVTYVRLGYEHRS